MDIMIANLTQRLENLERDNRRLKRMAGVSALVIGALMLTGQLTAGTASSRPSGSSFVMPLAKYARS